jgi:hypothetical protein
MVLLLVFYQMSLTPKQAVVHELDLAPALGKASQQLKQRKQYPLFEPTPVAQSLPRCL